MAKKPKPKKEKPKKPIETQDDSQPNHPPVEPPPGGKP